MQGMSYERILGKKGFSIFTLIFAMKIYLLLRFLRKYLGGNKKWKVWLADQGWMGRRVNDKWNKCTMMGMQ